MVSRKETLRRLISVAVNVTPTATDRDDIGVTIVDHLSFALDSIFAQLQTYSSYRSIITMTEHKYYYLVPFSLISNIFSFAVLFKRLKKSTAYMFMANIAIWDAATILMRGIVVMMYLGAWNVGDTGCAIVRLLVNTSRPIAQWLVIPLTADRIIAVWFPFKYRTLCTMPRALLAYALIVAMTIGVCINNLWLFTGVSDPPHYSCKYKAEHKDQLKQFLWAYFVFQSLLPTFIVVLLNVALV